MFSVISLFTILVIFGTPAQAREEVNFEPVGRREAFHICDRTLANPRLLHDPLKRTPRPDGIVTETLEITPENMITAYRQGIYLHKENENHPGLGVFVRPAMRGVMRLNKDDPDKVNPEREFPGISRRDIKYTRQLEREGYTVTFNEAFERVVEGCDQAQRVNAANRQWRRPKSTVQTERSRSWLTENVKRVFVQMHHLPKRYAQSVEVWKDGELVAGLFGTFVSGVFTGESMFYVPGVGNNAAKLAVRKLIHRLTENDHLFIDTQIVRGLMLDMGADLIPSTNHLRLMHFQQSMNRPF